ncbi:MAG TPA: hypothetical protein VGF52_03325, partial [Tepidisphaeraceae bacterium]
LLPPTVASRYNLPMPQKLGKIKAAKKTTRAKPLKLPGTFAELISQSLQAKKPAKGWPKGK